MEALGFKRRLMEAKTKKEFLKIIFQYPASERAIVKRGYVVTVSEDGFDFKEIIDGNVTYAFKYLVEIKNDEENEKSQMPDM